MRLRDELRGAALASATESFLSFVATVWPNYEFAPHNVYLIKKLDDLAHGRIKRLMTFMPPRHGKSLVTSRLFPAFILGRDPDMEVMIASYGADLSYDFSRSVRSIIQLPSYPFRGVRLQPGRASVKAWGIEDRMGGLVAAGVGGPMTGRGAGTLLLDDVVKDRLQADSPVYRERGAQWYGDVARTRLAPYGAIGLTLTRWHEGDIAGLQLEAMRQGGEQWEVVCMPALAYGPGEAPWYADTKDPLGRQPGDALWPKRFSKKTLEALRDGGSMSMRSWLALYQQNTSATAGNVYKREWFNNRFAEILPQDIFRIIIPVDAAFKEGVGTSYSAMAAWAKCSNDLAILDAWRGRVEYDDLVLSVVDFWNKVVEAYGITPTVVIENKASGQSLVQTLRRQHPGVPVTVFPDPDTAFQKKLATASKEARADSATPPFRAGVVRLPRAAPWLHDFIEEHCNFPTAINNDWVDVTGIAVAILYTEAAAAAAGAMISREELMSGRGHIADGYNAERRSILDPRGRSGYNASRGREWP